MITMSYDHCDASESLIRSIKAFGKLYFKNSLEMLQTSFKDITVPCLHDLHLLYAQRLKKTVYL